MESESDKELGETDAAKPKEILLRLKIWLINSLNSVFRNPEGGIWMTEGSEIRSEGGSLYVVFYVEKSKTGEEDYQVLRLIVPTGESMLLQHKAFVVLVARDRAVDVFGEVIRNSEAEESTHQALAGGSKLFFTKKFPNRIQATRI